MTENNNIKLAVMATDIAYIKSSLSSIDNKVSSQYVTKDEFKPVQRIVYGLVAVLLTSVVLAMMALILK